MKITYVTGIMGMDGLSAQGLNYCEELSKRENVELSIIADRMNPAITSDRLKEVLSRPTRWNGDAMVVNGIPWYWKRYFPERFKRFFGYCVLEGDTIPKEWVDVISDGAVDKVFVPSEATKSMFIDSGVSHSKIAVVPHGIDPEIFRIKEDRKTIPNGENRFKFLSVGGWGKKNGDRKGTDILIRAFAEEFRKGEDVMLVIKVNKSYNPGMDVKKAIREMNLPEDRAPIYLIEDNMYAEDLSELYNACDCYVSPTKGEAFGMTILEALACGLPVIVTNNDRAGYVDFCSTNSQFIKTDGDAEIPREEILYESGWVNPDRDDLRRLMRRAFEKKAGKDQATSDRVRREYSWASAVDKMIKEIGGQ